MGQVGREYTHERCKNHNFIIKFEQMKTILWAPSNIFESSKQVKPNHIWITNQGGDRHFAGCGPNHQPTTLCCSTITWIHWLHNFQKSNTKPRICASYHQDCPSLIQYYIRYVFWLIRRIKQIEILVTSWEIFRNSLLCIDYFSEHAMSRP